MIRRGAVFFVALAVLIGAGVVAFKGWRGPPRGTVLPATSEWPPVFARGPRPTADAGFPDAGPGLELTGRVLASGSPVPSAVVHLGATTTRAGADGRFRVALPAAWTALWATDATGASRAVQVSTLSPRSGEVDLVLLPAATLRVRALDAASGVPLPGAQVSLHDPPLGLSATTDADGRAEFSGLPAGELGVAVAAPGHVEMRPYVVLGEGRVFELELPVEEAAAISGRVVDAKGAPLAGATVRAFRIGEKRPEEARATSGADGRFRVEGLFARDHRLEATLEGFAHVIAVAQAPADDLVVALDVAASVEGTVTDSAGHPIEAANVSAKPRDGQPTPSRRRPAWASTDAAGAYRLAGLLPGGWQLEVDAPGVLGLDGGALDVEPGERARRDFVLPRDQNRVFGRVLDATSEQPLAGAKVWLSRGDDSLYVATGAEGTFSFGNVDAAVRKLQVEADGYAGAQLDALPGATPLTLRLVRTPWVIGRAVDPAGSPIPDVDVDGVSGYDPGGRFLAAPATDTIELNTFGTVARTVRVKTEPGRIIDLGDVVLDFDPTVHFTVLDLDGGAARAATVFLPIEDGRRPMRLLSERQALTLAVTDAHGHAEATAPAGKQCFFALRYPSGPSPVEACPFGVSERGSNDVTLAVQPAAWISGRVTAGGVPLRGVVMRDDADLVHAVTDADGRYRLGPLGPGAREVVLVRDFTEGTAPMILTRVADAGAGDEVPLDVELEGGASLEVRLAAPADGPISVAVIDGTEMSTDALKRMVARQLTVVDGHATAGFSGLSTGEKLIIYGWADRQAKASRVTLEREKRYHVSVQLGSR